MEIKINGIIKESIVDGPGIRYVIFTQGCFHACKGCHNPDTHNINDGYVITFEEILSHLKINPLINGVTFSGGEPMLQADKLSALCTEINALNKNIMVYSGFTYEQISENSSMYEFLKKCDILVDGKFEIEQKNMLHKFKGSSNQRIIDIKKSLNENKIVLSDYDD